MEGYTNALCDLTRNPPPPESIFKIAPVSIVPAFATNLTLLSAGRLPNADMGTLTATIQHVRDIFGRMGFTDREMVALIGAHAVGRCHTNASGTKSTTPIYVRNCKLKDETDDLLGDTSRRRSVNAQR